MLVGLTILGLASGLRAGPVQRPTQSIPREGCVTAECHPDVKSMRYTHGPVGVDACDACHEEADPTKHTFVYPRTGKDLCGFCHQLDLGGKYVHEPVAQGSCTECHNPHGGQERFMLRGGEGASSCAQCHADVTEGLPVVHGPVAAGICTTCHRPHSSDNPKLLTHSGPELCLECHLSTKRLLERVRNIHGPVSVDCLACHRPHAAAQKMLVKAETRELCLGCHSQIAAVIKEATTAHEAVSTGQACRNCHDPHGSDYPAILINDMVDVCLSCHDHEIELPDGTKLMNMKAVLAKGTSLHGPIAQRNCVACHQIHGGKNFRLLFKEYLCPVSGGELRAVLRLPRPRAGPGAAHGPPDRFPQWGPEPALPACQQENQGPDVPGLSRDPCQHQGQAHPGFRAVWNWWMEAAHQL